MALTQKRHLTLSIGNVCTRQMRLSKAANKGYSNILSRTNNQDKNQWSPNSLIFKVGARQGAREDEGKWGKENKKCNRFYYYYTGHRSVLTS